MITGRVSNVNRFSGGASHNAMRDGDCKAIALGINSPKTTWTNVMPMNERAMATEWRAIMFHGHDRPPNTVSRSRARIDSETQPRAMLLSVMPSCVAAMVRVI